MLPHYVTVTLRNARRAPVTAAVGVLTLALGLTCFVVAYAFVAFWQSAERHFTHADSTYALTVSRASRDSGFSSAGSTGTPEQAAEHLRTDFPRLANVARAVVLDPDTMVASDARAVRLFGVAIDAEFLEIFDLPFVAGDARTALSRPRSVVITEEYAERLFGAADPLGRSLSIGNRVDATVTGVIGAVPEPSHMGRSVAAPLRFDLLASRDVLEALRATDPTATPPSWLTGPATTYLRLPEDGSLTVDSLRARLDGFARRHVPERRLESWDFEFGVMPVRELLPRSIDARLFPVDVGVSVSLVILTLGALVLAVACVNYANLAAARAVARTRDAGLRKALGARPRQIVLQHLAEAAVVTSAALLVALAVLGLAAPPLEAFWGVDVAASLFAGAGVWVLLAVVVTATLTAGAYPAFVLSRFGPAQALRGRGGRHALSPWLVGAQFAVASFLLITVTITSLQNAALARSAAGPADPLVVIENPSLATGVSAETLRRELERLPHVEAVTELFVLPWEARAVNLIGRAGDPDAPLHRVMAEYVGYDFFDAFDAEVLAGRTFSREHGEDVPEPGRPMNVVVDRALLDQLGFASPQEAVGQELSMGGVLRIIGVVEQSRFSITRRYGTSTIYRLQMPSTFNAVVRISPDDVAGALAGIDATWQRLAPDVAIRRHFLEDLFDEAYATFGRIGRTVTALAVIAFVISVTGLFGMATWAASRRRHEIAVRKTQGASTRRMIGMLLAGFAKPIVIANLIAWPVAYAVGRAYLDVFIEPIRLTPAPFVLAAVVALGTAGLAVLGQTLRAARARPADVLRAE